MTSKPRTTKTTTTPDATKKTARGTSVNRVTLAGRLADPQLRTTASGISVTTVRLATTTETTSSSTTLSSGANSQSSLPST
jgi:hypothetical protein